MISSLYVSPLVFSCLDSHFALPCFMVLRILDALMCKDQIVISTPMYSFSH